MLRSIKFAFALFVLIRLANATTVSGTITDPTSQAFANGKYTVEFVNTPGQNTTPNVNGTPVAQGPFAGALDASGAFSVSLTDNTTVAPAGTKWRFTVCPASTSPCTSVQLVVSGATQDVSSAINAVVPVIAVQPTTTPPFANAYQDNEIVGPAQGTSYFNIVSNIIRTCSALPCSSNWISSGTASGVVLLAPSADQVILGTHAFVVRGVHHVGVDLSGLSAYAQSALGALPNYVGESFVFHPSSATDVAFSVWDEGVFGTAGYFASYGTGQRVGFESDAYTTSNGDVGIGTYGYAQVNSNTALNMYGHYSIVSTDATAFAPGGSVSGVAANYYADVNPAGVALTGGGKAASYYSVDRGSGANHYGIFFEGVTHNNLGGGVTTAGGFQPTAVAFASLPSCASGTEGQVRAVTDSNTVTWGANVAGSSTNHILAYCDGTNWTVAAK
jgi:hypothetical protein